MNRHPLSVSTILLLTAVAVPHITRAAPPQLTETATPIKVPPMMMVFAISPTSDRIAFVTRLKGSTKKTVTLDDTPGQPYDEIRPINGKQSVLFSPDAKHTAFVARTAKSWHVIFDNKEGPELQSVEDPQFSTDSSTLAYAGIADGKPLLIIDSGAVPTTHPLDGLDPNSKIDSQLTLSPDLKHFAYIAAPGTVIFDGKPLGTFNAPTKPILSPDGSRCGFLASDTAGHQLAIVDNQKFGPFDNLSSFTFSPDSKHFAVIRNGNSSGGPVFPGTPVDHAAILRDGQLEGEKLNLDSIEAPIVFSPDSSHLAFIADLGNSQSCVLDGKPGPTASRLHPPLFSPDSQHLAYILETATGVTVALDNTPGPTYRDISPDNPPIFSPDSKHLAFLSTENGGKHLPILDNKPVGTPNPTVPTLSFSPDSAHLIAQDNTHITIDGTPVSKPFTTSSPPIFLTPAKFQSIIANKEKTRRQVTENFYLLQVEIH